MFYKHIYFIRIVRAGNIFVAIWKICRSSHFVQLTCTNTSNSEPTQVSSRHSCWIKYITGKVFLFSRATKLAIKITGRKSYAYPPYFGKSLNNVNRARFFWRFRIFSIFQLKKIFVYSSELYLIRVQKKKKKKFWPALRRRNYAAAPTDRIPVVHHLVCDNIYIYIFITNTSKYELQKTLLLIKLNGDPRI